MMEILADSKEHNELIRPKNFVDAPVISVVMSVYNGQKYLRESIESILGQTYGNFEFIIINDGSTDSTREIILSYNDPRIRLIDNGENIGLTKSLNKGLRIARGEYIARMDADDVSMPARFESQLDFLNHHRDYAVVGTFLKAINEDSKVIFTIEKPIQHADIREFLNKDNCIGHGSAMIRKACLQDVGFYDESIRKSQDYELWLRISQNYRLANIPQYLYMWRNHKDNISEKHRNEQKHFVEMVKTRVEGKTENRKVDYYNEPKFSILMANYNNAEYIAEAIQSVLEQTFQDWELVIVDDCSNDDSIKVIEPYLKDERIRLLQNKVNKGYIGTLKRLVYESRAELLGILDSDDAITNDAIELMYDAYQKNPGYGFIYSQFVWCDDELNPVSKGFCDSISPGKRNLYRDCVSAFRTFRKKDYFKTEGFDESFLYAEDKDLIFKMEEVTNLLFVDKVLYRYRSLPRSQSSDLQKGQIGRISYFLAKYEAYKRRLNTDIPNLTTKEMAAQLLDAAILCMEQKKKNKAFNLLLRAIKLSPGKIKLYIYLCLFLLPEGVAVNLLLARKKLRRFQDKSDS
jgi:glycosyltransferase involved in cell wall biosynthesis